GSRPGIEAVPVVLPEATGDAEQEGSEWMRGLPVDLQLVPRRRATVEDVVIGASDEPCLAVDLRVVAIDLEGDQEEARWTVLARPIGGAGRRNGAKQGDEKWRREPAAPPEQHRQRGKGGEESGLTARASAAAVVVTAFGAVVAVEVVDEEGSAAAGIGGCRRVPEPVDRPHVHVVGDSVLQGRATAHVRHVDGSLLDPGDLGGHGAEVDGRRRRRDPRRPR